MFRFFCLLLLLPFIAKSQVDDGFTDGDFTQLPAWNGNNSKFIVNSSSQLQLNSSGTDTSYLSTPNTVIDSAEWNFWVKLSFAPSDNNYAKVYLVTDQINLKMPLNGYFIRLGENGSDDSVDLWEQTGTTETKIIDGINGHCSKSTNTLRVKVTRSAFGNWKVYSDTLGGINYALEGSINNTLHTSTTNFGISCKYTTSNATKFYFDDFYVGPIRIDTIAPAVIKILAMSSTQLNIYFNEPLEKVSAETITGYSVSDGIGNPSSALLDTINTSLVHLVFPGPFQGSKTYTLTVTNVKDKADNGINSAYTQFVLPEQAVANDIVINEILPDPNTGGVDFVEIYNRSDKVIDLSQLTLSSFDTLANQLSSVQYISTVRTLIFSEQYIVLSTNSSSIKSQYQTPSPSGFIDMAGFPGMNVASGIVVLADTSKTIIDRFDYRQDMHFPLLNVTKGVSLERIDADHITNDRNNWHSAAASTGYATPAYKNSQDIDSGTGKEITISPEIFSPDNDGNNDVVSVNYTFDTPGNVANVSIYNSTGLLVRNLVSNELLGNAGNYVWDGVDNNRELCKIGPYIIYFHIFNSSGVVKNYKKIVVLAHKN
ncbi:MAG: lamin tail domain-containing protein [Bacteroidetes bacterium]|nr:lamin tail domain-containing protein [Bacteroidota bacterium]